MPDRLSREKVDAEIMRAHVGDEGRLDEFECGDVVLGRHLEQRIRCCRGDTPEAELLDLAQIRLRIECHLLIGLEYHQLKWALAVGCTNPVAAGRAHPMLNSLVRITAVLDLREDLVWSIQVVAEEYGCDICHTVMLAHDLSNLKG